MPRAVACMVCHSRKKLCDGDYPCARCRCMAPQHGMDAGAHILSLWKGFSEVTTSFSAGYSTTNA
eukprot:3682116-Rhodomonas_salina.2